MSELMLETALSSSVLYQAFNGNAEMSQTIIKAIKNSTVITKDYIEEQILQIKRTNISPLADEVLQAYNFIMYHSVLMLLPSCRISQSGGGDERNSL